jgi:ABC-type antimicrobial peptide transport system permease subunit
MNSNPPGWPLKVLRFFVRKEYLEEIEGDMEELFRDNLEQYSVRKARRIYVIEIFKLFRPILMKNLEGVQRLNQYGMFKNYFKVSMRGLLKNPLTSFINVFGLSMAIGICMLAYGYARWVYGTDQFHVHKNEVHLATFFANRDGVEQQYGFTPRPLAEMMRQDFPQIEKVCRVEDGNVVVKNGDNIFNERLRYVDPEFLEMFTFPLKWGTASTLGDINSIILSEEMSEKYFGGENPIGTSIIVKFDKDRGKEFKVTGVLRKFPETSTITFSFLANYENVRTARPGYDQHDWSAQVNATFVQVDNPSNLALILDGMQKYSVLYNKVANEDWAISSFAFEPLATLSMKSENIKEDISRASTNNFKAAIFLMIIGGFLLLLACINYINIAIVSAARRLKEIGVRKSIGATRKVVMVQFLSENIVVTLFALLIGIFIGTVGFIPWFERVNEFSMDFRIDDPNLVIFLPIVLLLTAIASGAYPAFYVSKFQVVGILKGSVRFGKKNPITKIFLAVQLVLAVVFMSTAVFFTQNNKFLANRSWGYNQDEALYAVAPDAVALEQLSSVMSRNPDVLSLSASVHHVGRSHSMTIIHMAEREYEVDQLLVDANYFETLGIQLKEGRFFTDHEGSDRQAVMVNETMVKNMKWDHPTRQFFKIDSIQYQVIGVVKDFHSYSFSRFVRPIIFRVADKGDSRYLSLRLRNGTEMKTYEAFQEEWAKLFPEVPFAGGYQEDVWGGFFGMLDAHGKVWRMIAGIAIALASLGLYGLMTLNVASRVREFSIRKVLGAGLSSIMGLLTRQYAWLFAIALVIGAPLSYFLNIMVFDMAYRYHMPIGFPGVALGMMFLVLVLVVTVAVQVRKVSKDSAVEGLKVE